MIRAAAKREAEAGTPVYRKVVNISSVSGTNGNAGQANYSSAKAGLIGLTKAMAKEWGRYKVNVNAVAFGVIETRLTSAPAHGGASINIEGREIAVGLNADAFKALERIIPLGRPGTVEEAAGAVYLLLHSGVELHHRRSRHVRRRIQDAMSVDESKIQLNRTSARLTQARAQVGSRAMLFAAGLTEDDLEKAQVGIASTWFEGNPCNMHLLALSEDAKRGVIGAGMLGMRFNTIGVSDGISMGTDGMSFSLPSRDLIADSIETVMSAQWYDGLITIAGCDKNMPGCLIAMARLDRPSLMVFGGTIRPGHHAGETLDIASVFQSYGEFLAGTRTETSMNAVVRHACPGAGACGGMYTANTMATAAEALGLTLPYSSSTPATDPRKSDECVRAGIAVRQLLANGLTPRQIITRASLDNALTLVMALGGSTNAVLHLIAIARAAGITLTIDDVQAMSDRVPFLADLKPSGRYVMEDVDRVGGTPAVMKYLLAEGLLDGTCMTVTGKTLAENLEPLPGLADGQDVIRTIARPLKATGHLQILRGNLATEGAVAKITGKEGQRFSGPARCFDQEEAALAALEQHAVQAGDVVVIRYEGPTGGPGMPEMLTHHRRDHGRGTRQLGRAHYRRPILGGDARIRRWPHHAGGAARRSARPRRGRRHDHHRRNHALAERASI